MSKLFQFFKKNDKHKTLAHTQQTDDESILDLDLSSINKTEIIEVDKDKSGFFSGIFKDLNEYFFENGLSLIGKYDIWNFKEECPEFKKCGEADKSAQAEVIYICPEVKEKKSASTLSRHSLENLQKEIDYLNTPIKVVRKVNISQNNDKILSSGNIIVNSIMVEIISLGLCNYLIKNQISPNFVNTSDLFLCKNKKQKQLYMISSYVKGSTLSSYMDTVIYSRNWIQLKSVLFQLCCSIYTLQHHFDLIHNDLHPKNVLINDTLDNVNIKYKINNFDYYVPINKNLVKIIDFGLARITGKLERPNNLKSGSYYDIPVLSQPQDIADQRRICFNILRILYQTIFKKPIKIYIETKKNEYQGFYKFENEYVTDDNTFKKIIYYILQELKLYVIDEDFHNVLEILKDAIYGKNIRSIIESHLFYSYLVKKQHVRTFKLTDTFPVSENFDYFLKK